MVKSHNRRLSRKESAARRRFVAGLILFILGLAAAIYFGAARHLPSFEPVPLSAGLETSAPEAAPVDVARAEFARDIYPYSVIAGGAASVDELKIAMARDPVVAAHYAGFAIDRTHVDRLESPRLAHVSYRIGNSVFWTRKPIALKAGEQVLTDGVHIARTRCGNQLAERPGEVSPLEPDPGAMDVPLPTSPRGVPLALLQTPIALPTALGSALAPGTGATVPATGGLLAGPGFGFISPGGVSIPAGSPEGTIGLGGEPPFDNPSGPSGIPGLPGTPGVPSRPVPSRSPGGPIFPPGSGGTPGILVPGTSDGPSGDGPHGGGTPGEPPSDPTHEPVSVPEPGTTLLLAGGVAYALRRLRAARTVR